MKEIYKDLNVDSSNKLFNKSELNIVVIPDFEREIIYNYNNETSGEMDLDFKNYKIEKLKIKSDNPENIDLSELVEKINKEINHNYSKGWNIFYLYKELFQKLVVDRGEGNYNYFRGQSDNWPLRPGLFRGNISEKFLQKFDSVYKDISREFPKKIQYYEYDYENEEITSKRAEQLAMLQHYGMKTSLLDITKNPFIGLEFMIMDIKNAENYTLDMFKIDKVKHISKNFFMTVNKNEENLRIKAQKGAFFDYDFLYKSKSDIDIEKIDNLRVTIIYDFENLYKFLDEQHENELSSLRSNLGDNKDELIKNNIQTFEVSKKKIIKKFEKEIIETIYNDLNRKLKEYFYLEKNLYPDFDKYIEYIQDNYIKNDGYYKLKTK
ncbi:FRG domain-containing protein [Companilactobacillus metriopterae]|uniref:FRG domain-containing protein n=1 Tax=Companilactobacillus metriopterae TaxID=1909267 RepID=UPI00100A406E|nr:FRG domain-containing protein [Companilactobacillus metriopterae]